MLRLQDPVKSTVAISLETLRSQRNISMHRGTLNEQHDVDTLNNAFNGPITSHHDLLLILGGSRDLSFHFHSVVASNPYITTPTPSPTPNLPPKNSHLHQLTSFPEEPYSSTHHSHFCNSWTHSGCYNNSCLWNPSACPKSPRHFRGCLRLTIIIGIVVSVVVGLAPAG